MKKILLFSAALALALPTTAFAAIEISSDPVPAPYVGPVTYEFEAPFDEWTGTIRSANDSFGAPPAGGSGAYAVVGKGVGSPGVLNLSAFGDIDFISFIWGSVDIFNILQVLDANDKILATFNGSAVAAPPTGNQTAPDTNRLVTLTFTGDSRSLVSKLKFSSNENNAFEFDRMRISAAVPEPTTWMLMLMGMAGIGFTMRRKEKQTLRVRFA